LISAVCRTAAIDRRQLPDLPDSFFVLTPADVARELDAQNLRRTFQGNRPQSQRKTSGRVKFQFDHPDIVDLVATGTFAMAEPTARLFEFLDAEVFAQGTTYAMFGSLGKQIQLTTNQRLQDVGVIGNTIICVRVKNFTGVRDNVAVQLEEQREIIRQAIAAHAAEAQPGDATG
jgi:hypothetical protein